MCCPNHRCCTVTCIHQNTNGVNIFRIWRNYQETSHVADMPEKLKKIIVENVFGIYIESVEGGCDATREITTGTEVKWKKLERTTDANKKSFPSLQSISPNITGRSNRTSLFCALDGGAVYDGVQRKKPCLHF